jgi:hypothetical protein
MRKGRIVTLIAGCVLSAAVWAAAAESPKQEKAADIRKAASKPAPVDASRPGGKPSERKRTGAPQVSGATSKTPLLQLDEKNLGLGCAQP